MRVFLDAVSVIYMIDQNPTFGPRVIAWLSANPCDIVSSELVRMESLILPVRLADPVRIADFEDFFRVRVAEMVPLTRTVYDRAIEIRARYPFKTPDALHLATAVEVGCDVFLTNDPQLAAFTGIRVELI